MLALTLRAVLNSELISVKIDDWNPGAVLSLDCTNVMQMRSPVSVLLQVFREMPGEENMSRVAAIHDPLCYVDSSPSEIGLIVHICEWIDRAAVNAHTHFKFRMAL